MVDLIAEAVGSGMSMMIGVGTAGMAMKAIGGSMPRARLPRVRRARRRKR